MKRILNGVAAFYRTFRNCMTKAAQDSDTHYHIPKSRFADPETGRAGFYASPGKGARGRLGNFFGGVSNCFKTAWAEADRHYHIPKTRFKGSAIRGMGFHGSRVFEDPASGTSNSLRLGVQGTGFDGDLSDETQGSPSVRSKGTFYADPEDAGLSSPRLTRE